jgi:hypothetical protein
VLSFGSIRAVLRAGSQIAMIAAVIVNAVSDA